jgi:nitroimidazol reductase NimA-like FMN-containing flavoprotein (pyridoxamine 5'-phosphate oxidase superfamily)
MTQSRSAKRTQPVGAKSRPFIRVRRLADLGVYDAATIYAILDAATHCHVAHVIGDRPVATPTLHWRRDDRLYWHGSTASRMLKANRAGGAVCVTATLFDGFVLARSGFNHTVNYRSAMCFGVAEEITDAGARSAALEHFMEHWFPGRWATLRPPTRKELAATCVMSMPISEASAKVRDGGPEDAAADLASPVWAGVIPFATRVGTPLAAADFVGNSKPPSIARLSPRRRREHSTTD